MAWNIRSRCLPRVRSYSEAKQLHDGIKPHKNYNSWRPLVRRSDGSKLVQIDSEGNVRFRYHHTDVVVYRMDGSIDVTVWNSTNTVFFANELLPCGIRPTTRGGRMYVGDIDGYYLPAKGDTLTFQVGAYGNWVVDQSNVRQLITHELDLSKAAKIRKALRPVDEWIKSVRRVGGTFQPARNLPWGQVKHFLDEGNIPESVYPNLAVMALQSTECYVLGGAVRCIQMPPGSFMKETPYDHSPAWAYV